MDRQLEHASPFLNIFRKQLMKCFFQFYSTAFCKCNFLKDISLKSTGKPQKKNLRNKSFPSNKKKCLNSQSESFFGRVHKFYSVWFRAMFFSPKQFCASEFVEVLWWKSVWSFQCPQQTISKFAKFN